MKKTAIALLLMSMSPLSQADWYFRGTPNNWAPAAMEYKGEHRWESVQTFTKGGKFKVDRFGDWSESYGDNNYDGIGDLGGQEITVPDGKAYKISFFDDTHGIVMSEHYENVEYRDKTMYFLFMDRFSDGDVSNNEGNNAETYSADKREWKKYWGGDIRGLINKLDYLKGMGISAVWITAPVDNMDKVVSYFNAQENRYQPNTSYHGYWGKDYYQVDEHLGDWAAFDELVQKMHSPEYNMKLVLDFVPNHSSPSGSQKASTHVGADGAIYKDGAYIADFYNDPTGMFHHNQDDYDPNNDNVFNKKMGDLADFEQNNPETYDYLLGATKKWLDHGVDAIRIDAIKHMKKDFIQKWTKDVNDYTKSKGKDQVFFFGEWFGSSAWTTTGENGLALDYVNTSGSELLDFGLRQTIENVMTNTPHWNMNQLDAYLKDRDRKFGNPDWQITFVDNHDMARLSTVLQHKNPQNGETGAGFDKLFAHQRLEAAVSIVMTARGIPVIYYGTETYAAKFDRNADGKAGQDPFNREMMDFDAVNKNPYMYNLIKKLSDLRKNSKAIQQGSYQQKWISDDVLVFERNSGNDTAVIAINIGSSTTVNVIKLGLADGSYHNIIGNDVVSVSNGKATFNLNQNEVIVLH